VILNRPDLKKLFDDLGNLAYNTFDRRGYSWLPHGIAELLNTVITRTAAKAARF